MLDPPATPRSNWRSQHDEIRGEEGSEGGEGGREEREGTYGEQVVHGGAARREEQADGDEREREVAVVP